MRENGEQLLTATARLDAPWGIRRILNSTLRSSVRFNAMDARACLTSLVPMESHDMSSPNDCVCSQNAKDCEW